MSIVSLLVVDKLTRKSAAMRIQCARIREDTHETQCARITAYLCVPARTNDRHSVYITSKEDARMGFIRHMYIIPVLLLVNMVFIFTLHSNYLSAINDLNKQRIALEDTQYHNENDPIRIEKKEKVEQTLKEFNNWWKGEDTTSEVANIN